MANSIPGPHPPRRVQLSRGKGWRMPPNTVKVDRATRWGNPFVIGVDGDQARCVCELPHSSAM